MFDDFDRWLMLCLASCDFGVHVEFSMVVSPNTIAVIHGIVNMICRLGFRLNDGMDSVNSKEGELNTFSAGAPRQFDGLTSMKRRCGDTIPVRCKLETLNPCQRGDPSVILHR